MLLHINPKHLLLKVYILVQYIHQLDLITLQCYNFESIFFNDLVIYGKYTEKRVNTDGEDEDSKAKTILQ